MRSATKKRTGRDPKYLDFIRSLMCVCCYQIDFDYPSGRQEFFEEQMRDWKPAPEAAHVGERGLSQKCNDRETIPLCAEHHRTGKDSHHVLGKSFWDHWSIDKDALVAQLQKRFEEEQ